MINPHRFYGANAQQNIPNDSDSEDGISVDESSLYSPSHSSSSESSSESDSEESLPDSTNSNHNDEQNDSSDDPLLLGTWHTVDGTHRKQFVFADDGGIFGFSGIAPDELKPIDVYSKMVTDDIYDLIVRQTYFNAQQVISSQRISRKSRLNLWKDTDKTEVKKFLAIVLYMGVIKYPSIETYWSEDPFYKNNFVPQLMSRNRFQLLLRFIHFVDNQSPENDKDRLYKVRNLLTLLEKNFTECRKPGKYIAVDETMVPWRGRLLFRQYNPGKAHKYGVKIYKLCDSKGYTYTSSVYAGKNAFEPRGRPTATISHSTQIVLDLAEKYLKSGRTITTDNYYTSVALANVLLQNQTHLVGTLRKNRVGNPKDVVEARLRKDEIIGRENQDGVVIAKWKSRRDVIMLSTQHDLSMIGTGKKNRQNEEMKKPEIIMSYNKAKQGIDVSDQMASYFTPLRKTIRWYHKIGFEFLLNTAVVNAVIIFQELRGKIHIANFRHDLIYALADMVPPTRGRPSQRIDRARASRRSASHHLEKFTERDSTNRLKRKRCSSCYSEMKKSVSRENASKKAKKVSTYCRDCEGQPAYCLDCFTKHHH